MSVYIYAVILMLIKQISTADEIAEAVGHCMGCGRKLETDEQVYFYAQEYADGTIRFAVYDYAHNPNDIKKVKRMVEVNLKTVDAAALKAALELLKRV